MELPVFDMKRRLLLATVVSALISGCQALPVVGRKKNKQVLHTLELGITNNSDEKDEFNISVVKEGTVVYMSGISIQPGEQKRISKTWKGASFAIFGMSDTFSNYEVSGIDNTEKESHRYRLNFVIKENGDVQKKRFHPDN